MKNYAKDKSISSSCNVQRKVINDKPKSSMPPPQVLDPFVEELNAIILSVTFG